MRYAGAMRRRTARGDAVSAINSFFTSANASLYVDTLFSTRKPASDASPAASASRPHHDVDSSGQTAGQRALARIIEILTLGAQQEDNTAQMQEQVGYVTAGSGTEGDDTLTVTGRGIYNLDAGSGNDTLTLKSSSISNVATGAGNDIVKAAGSMIGGLDGGDGDDDIQLKADLALDISGGAGHDTIKVSADTILGFDGGDGNDSLTLVGNRIFATGGAGDDSVRITATGSDAVVEYGFGRGGGKDTLASTAPLSLALGSLSERDLSLSVSGNTLTASIDGTDDSIAVTLDGRSALTYSFTVKNGQTMLQIG